MGACWSETDCVNVVAILVHFKEQKIVIALASQSVRADILH